MVHLNADNTVMSWDPISYLTDSVKFQIRNAETIVQMSHNSIIPETPSKPTWPLPHPPSSVISMGRTWWVEQNFRRISTPLIVYKHFGHWERVEARTFLGMSIIYFVCLHYWFWGKQFRALESGWVLFCASVNGFEQKFKELPACWRIFGGDEWVVGYCCAEVT